MLWLILAIALWGALHSWLASLGVEDAARRRFGDRASRVYRLAYNIFSVVTFAPILLLVGLLPDRVLYVVPPPWRYLMFAGELAAVLCLILVLLQVDAASFIGLRQLLQGERPPRFVTSGFYRWVRHPLYLFGLLILWLTPAMTVNLLVADLAMTTYLIIGARFEERKLLREFGSAYAEYRLRTPMFIPLLRQRKEADRPPPTTAN